MKVQVRITLDVDPDAWSEEYGVERDQVREDVKVLASDVLHDHLDSVGVLA